jgi:CHASE2 domain-containing sensor protein
LSISDWSRRLRLPFSLERDREAVRRAATTFAFGLLILILMQWPAMERSFLGSLDREMLDTAFKLRGDVIVANADPTLFLDIDDRTLSGDPSPANLRRGAPLATTPRGVIGDLLDFVRTAPPEHRPKVVLLDVDIATPTPGEAAAVERLAALLAAWASDPNAPPLVIAREVFPPQALGVPGQVGVLPATPYDAVVARAPNIFWGSVKMLADQEGVIREFLPYECARGSDGAITPVYSAVLLAYGFMQQGDLGTRSNARRWVGDAPAACAQRPEQRLNHGERINYHISLQPGEEDRVWPELPRDWAGYEVCGRTDTASFRRISAADIQAAGADVSRALLCQRLVVIGGTNTAANDFRQTPLESMSGPVILTNAIRGLQMSDGGLHKVDFALQVLVLLAVCLAISLTFTASRNARERYHRIREARAGIQVSEGIKLILLNPVMLNAAVSVAAHFIGVGLLLLSLELSFWGYLSAPAVAAAIVETVQEFADD